MYGVVAIPAYLFGGPLADKFAPNKLMSFALLLTGLGGIYLYTLPDPSNFTMLYGFWGITTIFLFWAALFRTTRVLSGDQNLGTSYGLLDGGRGLLAVLIATVSTWMLAQSLPEDAALASLEQKTDGLRNIILFFSCMVVVFSALIFFALQSISHTHQFSERLFTKDKLKAAFSNKNVWFQAIIIVCAYSGYRVTDDFSLLAKDMLNYNDVDAAFVGTLALWIRPISAISCGYLADKLKPSTVMIYCFTLMLTSGLLMGFSTESYYGFAFLVIIVASTSAAVYAMRGLYFAIMGESKIPLKTTGTIVGLVSVIGFLPDIYMAKLMGYYLDHYQGIEGHRFVFILLAGFSFVGLLAVLLFKKVNYVANFEKK